MQSKETRWDHIRGDNEDILHIPGFIPFTLATRYSENLMHGINWQDELQLADGPGKKKIRRKMSYVSDIPELYRYTNLIVQGETWNPVLVEIRSRLENDIDFPFNSVLLNLYRDGKDEIRWHSDKEDQLGEEPVIACVNFGATRSFRFKKKETGEDKVFPVANGDLLLMGPQCQKKWLHAILKEKEVTSPRISLTFRWVYGN